MIRAEAVKVEKRMEQQAAKHRSKMQLGKEDVDENRI